MWIPQIISLNILYTSCLSLISYVGLLRAMWLLEAASLSPETALKPPGARELLAYSVNICIPRANRAVSRGVIDFV